jgi:hypothetical protein
MGGGAAIHAATIIVTTTNVKRKTIALGESLQWPCHSLQIRARAMRLARACGAVVAELRSRRIAGLA